MILPPFACPEAFKSGLLPPEGGEAHWFLFSKDHLLVSEDKKKVPTQHNFSLQRALYIGSLNDKHFFAGEVEASAEAPPKWSWSHLRSLHAVLSEEWYALAGRALQLIYWDRSHQHCGCCGKATVVRPNERCRECSSCGQLAYPKMAPAVMALIKRDDQILLARSPHFPEKFYSVLAGYVDPGETLEQCVQREVQEEVGLKVKNIKYFGSQPWPFSQSLMIAFTCDWESGEIKIDPSEIEDAAWFNRSNFPQLAPPLSLARMLIDSHL